MSSSLWRAVKLPIPDGFIAVDVAGSGKFARQHVSVSRHGTARSLGTLTELRQELQESKASAEQLAIANPVAFAYVLCVLAGKPHHVFPRDNMWPDLERCFGLERPCNEAKIEAGKFIFLAYSQYLPTLTVSRITVDLDTLDLKEDTVVSSPWPLPANEGCAPKPSAVV